MTAPAFVSGSIAAPVLPYRRRPAYRGPLVVVPGGRARARQTANLSDRRIRVVPVAGQSNPPSPSRGAAVAAFQAQLRALPVKSEISLNLARRSCQVDGQVRQLTPSEFGMLAALATKPGEPISRSDLLALSRNRDLNDGSRTVDVHIAHLRDKLALRGVIATVRGRGYALNPAFRIQVN
jgi:DNA-binding response OmpR family regulator